MQKTIPFVVDQVMVEEVMREYLCPKFPFTRNNFYLLL